MQFECGVFTARSLYQVLSKTAFPLLNELRQRAREAFINKASLGNGRFLYSFHDVCREFKEKTGFIAGSVSKDGFKKNVYDKKKEVFSVIVFESGQDLTCPEICRCYS